MVNTSVYMYDLDKYFVKRQKGADLLWNLLAPKPVHRDGAEGHPAVLL